MTAKTGTGSPRMARESLHDQGGTLVGYGLTFAAALQPGTDDTDGMNTARLIATAFGEFGLDRMAARRHFHLQVPRPLVTGRVPMPFGPQHVVLVLRPPLVVDDELVAGVRELKARGYRVAVDAWAEGPALDDLLPLADFAVVGIGGLDAEIRELTAYLRFRIPRARLIAEGVPDADSLRRCGQAGFDLMQGPYFDAVRPGGRRGAVAPGQVASLRLLAALASPETPVEELEAIVATDPGLALRVLTAVNSASGTGRAVGSLRQAVVLLGRRALSAWVMLAALGGGGGAHREDEMVEVLSRARACELLSDQAQVDADSAYAAGLLCGLADVLGADLDDVARAARLDDELTAALTERRGRLGHLLDLVTGVQHEEPAGPVPGPRAGVEAERLAVAALQALGSAVTTLDDVLGPAAG